MFQVTMHNIQVRICKNTIWASLPYMVADEEIDCLIATWPPQWKVGFKSGAMDTARMRATKVTPPTTAKETGGLHKGTEKEGNVGSQKDSQQKNNTQKDVEAETQTDSQSDPSIEALDAGGTIFPPGHEADKSS